MNPLKRHLPTILITLVCTYAGYLFVNAAFDGLLPFAKVLLFVLLGLAGLLLGSVLLFGAIAIPAAPIIGGQYYGRKIDLPQWIATILTTAAVALICGLGLLEFFKGGGELGSRIGSLLALHCVIWIPKARKMIFWRCINIQLWLCIFLAAVLTLLFAHAPEGGLAAFAADSPTAPALHLSFYLGLIFLFTIGMSTRREVGMYLLLLLLILLSIIYTSGYDSAPLGSSFLKPFNLINVAKRIGNFGIIGIAVGLVIITAGIDLSIGSLIALLGLMFAYLLDVGQWGPPAVWWHPVLIILALGFGVGAFHGFFVTKVGMQPFIVTLCGLLAYRGLARTISSDQAAGISNLSSDYPALYSLFAGKIFGLPVSFIYLVVIAVIFFVVLHKSIYGRYLFAAGRNEQATRYAGIRTDKVIRWSYALCGLLTGFSALLFAVYSNGVTPSSEANFYELYAIAAAVIGGCSLFGGEGSVIGILIGTGILVLLRNMVNLVEVGGRSLDSSAEFVVLGVVIFLGVLFDTLGPKIAKNLGRKLEPLAAKLKRKFARDEAAVVTSA